MKTRMNLSRRRSRRIKCTIEMKTFKSLLILGIVIVSGFIVRAGSTYP